MISKISAILAAALVSGLRVLRLRKPTGKLAGKRPTRTPTIRTREISATGTQTTPSLTHLLGRCLTVLLRTKILLEPHWFVSPCDSKNGSDAQRVAAISLICEGITSNYEDSRTTP